MAAMGRKATLDMGKHMRRVRGALRLGGDAFPDPSKKTAAQTGTRGPHIRLVSR